MQLLSPTQWRKERKVANFLQYLFASQYCLVFSRSRRPETHICHQKDYQRTSTIIGSVKIIQRVNTAVNWVEQPNMFNFEKKRKRIECFSDGSAKHAISHRKKKLEDAKTYEVNLTSLDKAHHSILEEHLTKINGQT